MAEILNYGGRKYIRWSMGQPPIGTQYTFLTDAQFDTLQRRLEAERPARVIEVSTPVNPEAIAEPKPKPRRPAVRMERAPYEVMPDGSHRILSTHERLKLQGRVAGQIDTSYDLGEPDRWTAPGPTDPRFWSHLGEEMPRPVRDSSTAATEARDVAWLVRDKHGWARTTISPPYRVRAVEDNVYDQMTNRAALQDDIRAIRFKLKYQDLNSLEEKALRVEMNHKLRLVNELHGKIRAGRMDAADAERMPLGEFEPKMVAEMMEENAGELVQDVVNRDLDQFDDHISRPHKLLIERYEQEMARERMSVSTARRYFMVSSARDSGLGQMGYRGTHPYGVVEFGDYVQYQQIGDERVVREQGSSGIWVRDRDVLPSPILDQISHRVEPTEAVEHVRGELRPELRHMITSYFKADKRGDDKLEAFLDETDVIGRRISGRFDEAFERLAGADPTDAMRADLETAKSLFMGTLYDTPGTRADPELRFSIDPRGVSSREQMRGILIDNDRDPFLRDLLYDVAPELRSEVERSGVRVSGKRLQGILGKSASRMRVAENKRGIARAVNARVRRKRQIEVAQRRIGSSLDALSSDGRGNEYNAALNAADRALARRPKALPPVQSVMDELFGLGDDEPVFFQDDILDILHAKTEEYRKAKKTVPKSLDSAFAIASDMQPTDIALIASDMSPQELARYKLSDSKIRAYSHVSAAAKEAGVITPDVQARARAYVERRLHKPRTAEEKGIDALQRAKNADKKAMEDAERAAKKLAKDTADALDFLEPHKRAAMLRSITASGVSDQDAGFILDLMHRSPDGRSPINPMVGGSRGEVMHQLGILSDSDAVISMEGGLGENRFMSQFVIESVRDASETAAAKAGAGNLSEILVTYRATGDVAQTLANAGVGSSDAARMAAEGDPAVFTQRYRYQRIKAEDIDFTLDRSALDTYEELALDKLQWTFPDEDPEVLRTRVREQIDQFMTDAPEEFRQLIASHVDVGRYVPIANTARIADLQSEGYVASVLESAYGEANTVTSTNARYSDGLISRIFQLQSPYGRRYLGEHGHKSLFRVGVNADGNKQLMMNELFNPISQPHEAMEMDSTVRSVLDEITEKMGGIDQVEEMIRASSVDTFDLPRSVLDEVSIEKQGAGAVVDTSRYTTGPVSTGSQLDVSYNAEKATLDEIEQRYGFRPEDRHFRSTLGEVFAEALNARREEGISGVPIASEGAEPARPRSSRIIDDLIVKPAKEHMDTLKDERVLQHMSPEQAKAFGVNRMAETAEEGAEHMRRSGIKLATMEDMGKLFRENKSLRYGAVAVGGLAAWGAYRNHRAKQDHTFEDMRGPAHLPGGSAYENPPQGFTNENTPSFADQSGGVTYHVDARGQFDPNALATAMNSHVGGSIQMNIQHSPDPIRQRSQKMEDMINGY